jgi:hypothetical protein
MYHGRSYRIPAFFFDWVSKRSTIKTLCVASTYGGKPKKIFDTYIGLFISRGAFTLANKDTFFGLIQLLQEKVLEFVSPFIKHVSHIADYLLTYSKMGGFVDFKLHGFQTKTTYFLREELEFYLKSITLFKDSELSGKMSFENYYGFNSSKLRSSLLT